MKGDLKMKPVPGTAAAVLLIAVVAGLGLGGCAGDLPGSAVPPSTPTTTAAELKPTTFGVSGPRPAQYATPTFRAPAQIGDRPVMTPDQSSKMQSDLEALAKQREQQLLQSGEEQGQ